MENIIENANKEVALGYYEDFVKGYKKLIKEFVDKNDTENAQYYTEELEEINEYRDFKGLLIVSENNGMGFTCKPLIDAELLTSIVEDAEHNADMNGKDSHEAIVKALTDYEDERTY